LRSERVHALAHGSSPCPPAKFPTAQADRNKEHAANLPLDPIGVTDLSLPFLGNVSEFFDKLIITTLQSIDANENFTMYCFILIPHNSGMIVFV
jgi:hypothetical protein